MATKHRLAYLVYDNTDNIDLIRRYCPGLEGHSPLDIAMHCPADPSVCWPWDGSHDDHGYGTVSTAPTPYGYAQLVHTHRYMYDLLVGTIDTHNYVHHRCRNTSCWNPFHLQEVTPKEHHAIHFPA